MSDERFELGLQVIAELYMPPGAKPTKVDPQYPAEIADDWNQLSISTVMGDVWGRPGLPKTAKAMITIAALTVLDKPEQLKVYVQGALNLGVSREQICEVVLHMSVYGGFPAAIQALGVVKAVFDTLDETAEE